MASLSVNQKASLDVEMIKTSDGRLLLPLKYLAELMDITVMQSPEDMAVAFTTPVGSNRVRIEPEKRLVTEGESFYTLPPEALAYLDAGMFSENEIYLEQSQLEKLLDVQLGYSDSAATLSLSVSRPIKLMAKYVRDDEGRDWKSIEQGTPVEAEASSRILETVTLDLNGNRNQFATSMGSQGAQTTLNSVVILSPTFKGHVRGLPYAFTPSISYGNGELGLSNLRFRTDTKLAGKPLQIGTLDVTAGPVSMPSVPIMGLQWGTPNALDREVQQEGVRTFEGKLARPGVITLSLNGRQARILDTRREQNPLAYRFKNIALTEGRVNTVRITLQKEATTKTSDKSLGSSNNNALKEEVSDHDKRSQAPEEEETLEETLYEAEIPYFRGFLAQGETAHSLFLGRAPFQFRIPGFSQISTLGEGEKEGFILPHSNKWLAGGRIYKGLSDNLTGGLSFAADTIVGTPQTSRQFQMMNRFRNANLLGQVSRFRDPNLYSGFALGGELLYQIEDDWLLRGALGVSQSRPAATLDEPGGFGKAATFSLEHQADRSRETAVRLFYYGDNYYTPMTSADNGLMDRYGVEIDHSGELLGFSYALAWQKYRMNLADFLPGGLINGERWNLNLARQLGPYTRFQLSINRIRGINETQESLMQNDFISLIQMLPLRMSLNLNLRRTTFATYQDAGNDSGIGYLPVGQNRVQTYLGADLNIPVKKFATLGLGAMASQQYNLATLRGTFRWGGLEISPQIQKSLGGEQSLEGFGLGMYYRWENQRRVGFRYMMTRSTLPSLSALLGGEMQSVNHSLQFDFNDVFALLGHHVLSVGQRGESTGVLECFAYFDRNQNGAREKDEPLVSGIPLVIDRDRALKSNRKHTVLIKQLSPGAHSVDFRYDELPMNLTPTTDRLSANIQEGRLTRAGLGIFVTPGTVSGKVIITDASGTKITAIKDIIVSLLEKQSGKEVKFTYTDKDGAYAISEIPPGQYIVRLDQRYAEQNRLKLVTKSHEMDVPLLIDDFYDKKDMDFQAIQLFNM